MTPSRDRCLVTENRGDANAKFFALRPRVDDCGAVHGCGDAVVSIHRVHWVDPWVVVVIFYHNVRRYVIIQPKEPIMTMSIDIHPQYITNEEGEKLSVILPVNEFEQMLEDIEDLAVALSRKEEKTTSHDDFLDELKRDGIL